VWLQPGDQLAMSISGIGTLQHQSWRPVPDKTSTIPRRRQAMNR
jgi:hypothetical protein